MGLFNEKSLKVHPMDISVGFVWCGAARTEQLLQQSFSTRDASCYSNQDNSSLFCELVTTPSLRPVNYIYETIKSTFRLGFSLFENPPPLSKNHFIGLKDSADISGRFKKAIYRTNCDR